jgi:hypothetical protein
MTMRGWESYVPPGAIGDDGRVRVSKGPKYGNRKTTVDGITFDSAKEARRWNELRMLEKAGTITGLRRQIRFPLEVNGEHVCWYVSDFLYQHGGKEIVEDVKGMRTDVYRLKKRLMLACHGIAISEV